MVVSNPHDKFFQDLFSRRQAAQDFLRNNLPASITSLFDFDSLKSSKDSFIDPALRNQYSDILYQVTLLTGEPISVYILFEHKSYEDKMVAFQLLKYIWAADFGEQFQAAARLLFALSDKDTALRYLETMLRYAASAAEHASAEELRTIVEDLLTEGDDIMPTIAEKWVEEGRQEGIEIGLLKGLEVGREEGVEIGMCKGVEEGRQEGEIEGQRAASVRLLRRFLAREFDLPLDHFDDQFAKLDFEAITTLSEAAFEVTTLAEFETLLDEVTPSDDRI